MAADHEHLYIQDGDRNVCTVCGKEWCDCLSCRVERNEIPLQGEDKDEGLCGLHGYDC